MHVTKRAPVPTSKRHFYLSLILSVLILVLFMGSLVLQNTERPNNLPKAVAGVLDLSDLDVLHRKPIDLSGEWAFYPEVFTLDFDDLNLQPEYLTVPGSWHLSQDDTNEQMGFGTYRLVLRLKEDGRYAFKTSTIRSAAHIFVDGKLENALGVPGRSLDAEEPESRYLVCTAVTEGRQVELVVQVSNYHYDKGGILKAFTFGSFEAIQQRIHRGRAFELVVTVMFFLLGAMFLFLFLRHSKSKSSLYFAWAAIFMGLYTSTMNYQNLSLLFSYSFMTRSVLQSIFLFGSMLLFLLFTKAFFPKLWNRRIGMALFLLNALSTSVTILTVLSMRRVADFRLVRLTGLALLISSVLNFVYVAFLFARAAFERKEDAGWILVASVSFISYWIAVLLKIFLEWELAYASDLLLLLTLLALMFTILGRMQRDFIYATELTKERVEQEFKYFFSQISPHFLHNTLNTIIALSYDEPEKTREALTYLSVYFRGKMDLHLQSGLIPLDDEIEMVTAYLEIERMRFGDRLEIVYDLDPDLACMVPPLTLQPLAENAVKHGVAKMGGMGKVSISSRRVDDKVHLTIKDNGPGISNEQLQSILRGESDRLGLVNIIRKIDLLEGASIDFKHTQDGFWVLLVFRAI